jgi:hypothetical protein
LTVAKPGRSVWFPARNVTLHAEFGHLVRVLLRDLVGESVPSHLKMANQRIVRQTFDRNTHSPVEHGLLLCVIAHVYQVLKLGPVTNQPDLGSRTVHKT